MAPSRLYAETLLPPPSEHRERAVQAPRSVSSLLPSASGDDTRETLPAPPPSFASTQETLPPTSMIRNIAPEEDAPATSRDRESGTS